MGGVDSSAIFAYVASENIVTYRYNGVELTLNLRPGKNADKVYAWINSVFA